MINKYSKNLLDCIFIFATPQLDNPILINCIVRKTAPFLDLRESPSVSRYPKRGRAAGSTKLIITRIAVLRMAIFRVLIAGNWLRHATAESYLRMPLPYRLKVYAAHEKRLRSISFSSNRWVFYSS